MMTEFLIKLIRLFRKIYTANGIDFEQLIAIVRVKLLTDNRRQNAAMTQEKRDEQPLFDGHVLLRLSRGHHDDLYYLHGFCHFSCFGFAYRRYGDVYDDTHHGLFGYFVRHDR
jgi:hypothetical protein